MSAPILRRAGPDDAQTIAEIGARTFRETFAHLYDPVDLSDYLAEAHGVAQARTDLAHPAKALWLVEDGGVAIGYALAGPCDLPHPEVTDRCLELKRIYFVAGRQGGGLGGRLFDEVMAWMERDGPRDLWIGVWSENFGAQRFYGRRGFEKVGEYGFRVGRTVDHEFILRRGAAASTTLDQHRSK